jgi:protein tyrosine phosphatase
MKWMMTLGYALFLVTATASLLGLNDDERRATFQSIVSHDRCLIPSHLLEWIDAQAIHITEFDRAAAKIDITKGMRKVSKAEKYTIKPATYGRLPEHIDKNIHIGCIPYDDMRTLRHIPGFYISATDVLTPEQAYIVSEAPMRKTENDFWRTIIEAKVQAIVALVTKNDDTYWDSSHLPQTVGEWVVERINEEVVATSPFLPNQRLIRRTFSATSLHCNCKRLITHLQYENWPDHGEPEGTLFMKLLSLLEEDHHSGTKPVLVHCEAGVGRSGTFVAAHSLRLEVQKMSPRSKTSTINIFRRMLEMRMQRPRMLSQPIQLRAVIAAVQEKARERSAQDS